MSVSIAHVTTAHPPDDNRILLKECTCLAEEGHTVTMLARGPAVQHASVRHEVLPRRNGRLSRALIGTFDVWTALRKVRPDVIHVHDPELIPLAALWRLVRRKPAVYDAHEDLPAQVQSKTYISAWLRPAVVIAARLLEGLADRSLSAIVIAEPVLRKNYKHNNRVRLVQNFPWLREFPKARPMPEGQLTLGYVGAISEHRGIQEMVSAVHRSSHDPRLVLAGTAFPLSLEHKLRSAGENVDYLGKVDAAAIPNILADVHVGFCVLHPLPNYVNAQSTKIFEYMAAGRPFIYSNFYSWVDMFGELEIGISVDPHNVDEIERAIHVLADSPDLAAQMGRRGRAALEKEFTFERERAVLIDLMREVLAS